MLIYYAHCLNFGIMQINVTSHASGSDTRIKERVLRGLYIEMSTFSTNEYYEMVLIYDECGR